MQTQIRRSTGTPITGTPYVAGGGYQGCTQQLDAAVEHAASLLNALTGRNVEIRFNSDRQSGGAWLDTQPYACDVGINAQRVLVARHLQLVRGLYGEQRGLERHKQDMAELGIDIDRQTEAVVFFVYLSKRALKDASLAMERADTADAYLYRHEPSLEAALDRVRELADLSLARCH